MSIAFPCRISVRFLRTNERERERETLETCSHTQKESVFSQAAQGARHRSVYDASRYGSSSSCSSDQQQQQSSLSSSDGSRRQRERAEQTAASGVAEERASSSSPSSSTAGLGERELSLTRLGDVWGHLSMGSMGSDRGSDRPDQLEVAPRLVSGHVKKNSLEGSSSWSHQPHQPHARGSSGSLTLKSCLASSSRGAGAEQQREQQQYQQQHHQQHHQLQLEQDEERGRLHGAERRERKRERLEPAYTGSFENGV